MQSFKDFVIALLSAVLMRNGSALVSINEVNLRRARLVLGWWPCLSSVPGEGHLSWYVTSHPGQLSLAIPSWVGAMSTVAAKGRWRLAAGKWRQVWFVCGWQVKLCDPIVTHGPYPSALEMLCDKALYEFTLLYFTLYVIQLILHHAWY